MDYDDQGVFRMAKILQNPASLQLQVHPELNDP